MLYFHFFDDYILSIFLFNGFMFGLEWDFDMQYVCISIGFIRIFFAKGVQFDLPTENFPEIDKKD